MLLLQRPLYVLAGLIAVVLVVTRLSKSKSSRHQRKIPFYTQHLVDLLATGQPFPRGKQVQELMYRYFLQDVLANSAMNEFIPSHVAFNGEPLATLRVLTFNVHFWRSGYSYLEMGDNSSEVMCILKRVNPDVILLQEVTEVARVAQDLAALGYHHVAFAGSPDCHILPVSQASHPGERLQVLIASRWPFAKIESVSFPMSGHVSYVELEGLSFAFYNSHFSVRGPPEQRLQEVFSILDHAARQSTRSVAIGGDFNQPDERDYPKQEWRVIAQDLTNCGLPLSDGVAPRLRAAGFSSSFSSAFPRRWPPGSSAWNACLVDFLYSNLEGWRVAGSWLWYTSCSDHLPLIADYQLTRKF